MKWSLGRGPAAVMVLGALALAGCGGSATTAAVKGPAGTVLQAANTKALDTSYKANFSVQVNIDLSQVTGLSSQDESELPLLQAEINSARLTGTVEEASADTVLVSFRLSPLMNGSWQVMLVGGEEYLSENGSTWYELPKPSSGSTASSVPGLSNLKQESKSWGEQLEHSAQVTKMGTVEVDGQKTEQIQTTIPGTAMNQLLDKVLSQFAGSDLSASSELPALEKLISFGPLTGNSYVATSNGELARASASANLTLDLSQLASLAPGTSGLPGGSVELGLAFSADFSDYGQSFSITKPAHVSAGSPPVPSGLSGALSQA